MAGVSANPTGTRRGADSILDRAAERIASQIKDLVAEIVALRRENDELRREVYQAVQMLDRAGTALSDQRARSGDHQPAVVRRERGRTRGPQGRATPAAVTADVVRAVITRLGSATAAEIASEITSTGVPVSGRAVRFIAERAGAIATVGTDGQRRYQVDSPTVVPWAGSDDAVLSWRSQGVRGEL